MNSKQRVLHALNREKPDRVPFNFWMDRRLMERYEKKIGHRHWRVTHYGADVIETFLGLAFPSGRLEAKTGTNWLTEPLFEDWRDVDSLLLPDPSEEKVYELIQRDLREFPDTAVFLDISTAWGIIASRIGYENIYVDMYDHYDELKKLCRRITDIQKQAVERACRIGITALYIMEDVSTTRGLSMSPAMIQEHCFNYAAELRAVADSYEIPTLFHCCGKITDELADMFIELGVKAINPLQPSVNDTEEFAKKYKAQKHQA